MPIDLAVVCEQGQFVERRMLERIQKSPRRTDVFIHCHNPRQSPARSFKTILDAQNGGNTRKFLFPTPRFDDEGVNSSNQGLETFTLECLDDPGVTRDIGDARPVVQQADFSGTSLCRNPVPKY